MQTPPSTSIEELLGERETRYGNFTCFAAISQDLKAVMAVQPNWNLLSTEQKEALEMIAHKLARILNGDPNYVDNWVDVAGYATLVVQSLREMHPGN